MAELSQSPGSFAPARLWRRIDKVVLAFLAILAVLALRDPSAVWPVLVEAWSHLLGTLPFILLAASAIGLLKATGSERLLDGAFTGRETRMVGVGATVGGLSPFCSCEVIPFIKALLVAGAPLSAVMAFWLASPLMDPAMFTITWGGLGLDFAIAKTIFAVAIGLWGGFFVMVFARSAVFANPLREDIASGGCCGARKLTAKWRFWEDADRRQAFISAGWENLVFLLKWLALAYLIQALLLRYVPAEVIATIIGGNGIGPILIAASVGAPAYLNGYAAVPLIEGLLAQGMSPGAAMSFMISGGVSSIPAMVAVWALVKPRVFAAYLGLAMSGSVMAGLIWGMIA